MKTQLSDLHAFIVDMDGTLYLGNTLIPGAAKFFEVLLVQKKKYVFITNNSSADAVMYQRKLSRLGIPVKENQILTSGIATAMFLKKKTNCKVVFPVSTKSFENELRAHGFVISDKDVDYVVVGFDKTLTYRKLEKACLLISRGVKFIASHPDVVCPVEYGHIPDCGAITSLITKATGVKPYKIMGKPRKEMVLMALDRLGAQKEETAIIGDRLYTDIKMGINAGITSILVLTGETRLNDVKQSKLKPDYIFPSIERLAEKLEQ